MQLEKTLSQMHRHEYLSHAIQCILASVLYADWRPSFLVNVSIQCALFWVYSKYSKVD